MRCTQCFKPRSPATNIRWLLRAIVVWASKKAFAPLLARLWIWAAALAMATQARRTAVDRYRLDVAGELQEPTRALDDLRSMRWS